MVFSWYELDVVSRGSQRDSSSVIFIPSGVVGSGIYFCIVVVYVCLPCSFIAVVRVPVSQFSFQCDIVGICEAGY